MPAACLQCNPSLLWSAGSPGEVFAQHAFQLWLQVDTLPAPPRHEIHHKHCAAKAADS